MKRKRATGASVVPPVVAAASVARGASAIIGLGIGSIVATPFWVAETLINKTLGLDREKCPNCGNKKRYADEVDRPGIDADELESD